MLTHTITCNICGEKWEDQTRVWWTVRQTEQLSGTLSSLINYTEAMNITVHLCSKEHALKYLGDVMDKMVANWVSGRLDPKKQQQQTAASDQAKRELELMEAIKKAVANQQKQALPSPPLVGGAYRYQPLKTRIGDSTGDWIGGIGTQTTSSTDSTGDEEPS